MRKAAAILPLFLCLVLTSMPVLAADADSSYTSSAVDEYQYYEGDVPVKPITEPTITQAWFDSVGYMATDATLTLYVAASGLEVGKTYIADAVLTDIRGGITSSNNYATEAKSEFIASGEANETHMVQFTLDTTANPNQEWSAAVRLLDEYEGEVTRYDGRATPVTIREPQIKIDVVQGIIDEDLVVSILVQALNLQPETEYQVTGSLRSNSGKPYEAAGKILQQTVDIIRTQSDADSNLPGTAEISLRIPVDHVRDVTLYPVCSLQSNGVELALQRGDIIRLGSDTTYPQTERLPSTGPGESAAQPISTVPPLTTDDPIILEDLPSTQPEVGVQTFPPINTPLAQEAPEEDKDYTSLWITIGGISAALVIVLVLWIKKKARDSRGW